MNVKLISIIRNDVRAEEFFNRNIPVSQKGKWPYIVNKVLYNDSLLETTVTAQSTGTYKVMLLLRSTAQNHLIRDVKCWVVTRPSLSLYSS